MSNWIAVSKREHITAKWRPRDGFKFAIEDDIAPAYLGEIGKLITQYVLAFCPVGEGFKLVCLLGVGHHRNLYINNEDKWLGDYVPAHYRKYPFNIVKTSDAANIFVVEETALCQDAGQDLFESDGNLSPITKKMLDFLAMCDESERETDTACQELKAAGLIEPWDLEIPTISQGSVKTGGLFKINEAKLAQLTPEAFATLNTVKALKLAYGQLFSINQINQLVARLEHHNSQRTSNKLIKNDGFFQDTGTINFDNLD